MEIFLAVVENGYPPPMIKFIQKQTKVSHSPTKGAVMVSWLLDLQTQQLYSHDNPVSVFPPVFILSEAVFPGLDYLADFLQAYAPPQPAPTSDQARPLTTSTPGPPFEQVKLKALEDRREILIKQYEAANRQLSNTLDAASRVVIERQIKDLEQAIQAVEEEIRLF